MRTVIVCNGALKDYDALRSYFCKGDYIISVDGGARHLRRMGVVPNILLGDFDSANMEDINFFLEKGIEIFQFPAEKDITDSELAIEKAIENGTDEIVFLGAVGTRYDHSLANIFLLKKLMEQGIMATIIDEHNKISMFNKSFTIQKMDNYKLSLIPVSDKVTGVYTKGLKYPLNNATMNFGTSWGVSNEFYEDTAVVTIGEGTLLVCLSRD